MLDLSLVNEAGQKKTDFLEVNASQDAGLAAVVLCKLLFASTGFEDLIECQKPCENLFFISENNSRCFGFYENEKFKIDVGIE